MSLYKKIFWVLGALILLFFLALGSYAIYQQPKYKGEISLSNIDNPVNVYYDDLGVPHIVAETQEDAYVALGYVHAQDRLWQMELMRRISAGRLSELFGEKTIEVDRFFKSLEIEEAADNTISQLDTTTPSYKLTKAYLSGINKYINHGKTPIEYHLLGLEKEEYQLKDVYNVFGYMAFSFAMAHKTDPMLSSLKTKLGERYLRDLPIEIDSVKTSILGTHLLSSETKISTLIESVLEKLPAPTLVGSNSWIVGPKKTASGKVLFENDPHIEYSQPSTWYQAHIKTPTFESYGFYLGLIPFPMLGHNRAYAFGITMFENDDIDFYLEQKDSINKNNYVYKGDVLPFKITEKTIYVKDSDPVVFELKQTIHGPVVNDVVSQIESEHPITMDWVYTKHKNKLLEASFGMSHANSITGFEKAVSLIHAPGLNIMYGDAKGNIAWWAAAKLLEHSNDVNPKFVLNGSEGLDDQLTAVAFSENPHAINPENGFVYSANNQSFAILEKEGNVIKKGYHGYYLPEDRGRRIVALLNAKNNITKEEMMEMTLDVTSSTALEFLSYFPMKELSKATSRNVTEAVRVLENWKADFDEESIAATIYMKLIYVYLEETLQDEMGKTLFSQFLNTHVQKRTINHLIENKNSIWWDDIHTASKIETRKEILAKVFNRTIIDLERQLGTDIEEWNWGSVHSVEHKHPIGEIALFKSFLNVGPFETHGANEVLNNLQYKIDSTGVYHVRAGPSTRRVIDFSDVEKSKAIIPTGQSGNPFSKHYKDQSQKYLNGEFVPMLLNEKEIKKSKDYLVLKPE
jgi:penicillin amidase